MAEPYIGEIRLVAFNFAPRNWAECDGRLLPISQNTALFSLLGTFYGGNGQTTFALPDLRGRVAIDMGQGPGLSDRTIGEEAGQETHVLTLNEIPAHNHIVAASSQPAVTNNPAQGVFAKPAVNPRLQTLYHDGAPDAAGGIVLTASGGNQPHENRQPFTTLLYVIALNGIFPPRNRSGK